MASDVLHRGGGEEKLSEESLFVQVEKNKYRCTICEKIVPKHHLTSHLHVHTGYRCAVCGKEYTRKSSLTKHMKTRDHVKRKLFECELCDKSFTRKCTLDIHLQLHKLYQGVFVCRVCDKEFSQEMHLLDHMTKYRHHPTTVTPSSTRQADSPATNDVVNDDSDAAKVFHLPFPNEVMGSSAGETDLSRTNVVSSLELPKVSLLPLPNALLAISTSGSELSRPYTFKSTDVPKPPKSSYPHELVGSPASDSDLLKITSYNHSDLLKLSSSLASFSSFDMPPAGATTNVYVTSASHVKPQSSWTSGAYDKSYVEKMIYETSQACEIENSKDLSEPIGSPEHADKHLILQDNNQLLLKSVAVEKTQHEEKQIVYNDIQQPMKHPTDQEYTQILLKPIREDPADADTTLIYNDIPNVNKISAINEPQLLLKPLCTTEHNPIPPNVHRTLVYSGIPHVNNLSAIQDTSQMILIPISREQLTEAHLLDKRLVYGTTTPTTTYVDIPEHSASTDVYQASPRQLQGVAEEEAGEKQQILRNMLISNVMGSMHYSTTCQPLPGQTLVFDIGAPNGLEGDVREVQKDNKRLFSVSTTQSHGAVSLPTALGKAGQVSPVEYQEVKLTRGDRLVVAQREYDVSDNDTVPKVTNVQRVHSQTDDTPKIPQMKYLAHMKKLNIASLQREVSNASIVQQLPSPLAPNSIMMVEDSDKCDEKDRLGEDLDGVHRSESELKQHQATFIYDYVPHPRSITEDNSKGLVVYVNQPSYMNKSDPPQTPSIPIHTQLTLQAVDATQTNIDMTQVKLLPQFTTDSDQDRREGVGTPNTESTYSSVHSYSETSLFNDTTPTVEAAVAENGSTEEQPNDTEASVSEERMARKRVKKSGSSSSSSSSKRSKSESGYKTYKCSSCERYFPCASALERHRLNKHPPHVVCHTCNICGKALYHPSHVYIHMRTHV